MYCIEHFPTVRQNQHSSPRFQMMQMNNPKRLLFVDDESSIREMLPVILRRYGFQVTVAATVTEALQEITSREFDLLLSDLNIESESDGYVVVRAMRATNPRCVIVILTVIHHWIPPWKRSITMWMSTSRSLRALTPLSQYLPTDSRHVSKRTRKSLLSAPDKLTREQ